MRMIVASILDPFHVGAAIIDYTFPASRVCNFPGVIAKYSASGLIWLAPFAPATTCAGADF